VERNNINLITSGSRFEGTVEFTDYTRFEGYVRGMLRGGPGSELIVGENGVVEGKVEGDVIVVDGFIRGDIRALTKVVITGTGRVVGEILAPSICIEFGGYFDGKCSMDRSQSKAASTANN
jgi:cytoskeletal protein CcmA (bactofilin family)